MKSTKIIQQVSIFVKQEFAKRMPKEYTYHCLAHTEGVVASVLKIGQYYNLENKKLEELEVAAWFHDLGYAEGAEGHEKRSAKEAENFLQNRGFPQGRIHIIQLLILATNLGTTPQTLGEKIIRDADASHLGSVDFATISNKLRAEWASVDGKVFTELEWLQLNIDFLSNHKYFTTSAKHLYAKKKQENLLALNYKRQFLINT